MSVTLSDEESLLVLRAVDSKMKEYAPYPQEVQEAFVTPYLALRNGIIEALDKAQKKSSSSPAPK